jgi:HAD superfamily hydrolase (TIGR01509 family)
MARCVLIDLDGTLADSLEVMRACYEQFLERRGAVGSAEEFDQLNGPSIAQVVKILAGTHGLAGSQASLLREYEDLIVAHYEKVPPRLGALELVDALKRRHLSVAVVTSASRRVAQAWLSGNGFEVDLLIDADSVARSKPDPQPYQMALQRLSARPEEAVVIEDSPAGAASAIAAGIQTLVLAENTEGFPQPVLALSSLDQVREHLCNV